MQPPAMHWLEQAGCGVLACDAQGRIVSGTEGAARLLGSTTAAIVGRQLSDWCALPSEAHRLMTPGVHHCWLHDSSRGRRQVGMLVAGLTEGGPIRHSVVLQDLAAPAPRSAGRMAARLDP